MAYKNKKHFVYVVQTRNKRISGARVFRVKGPGHDFELLGLAEIDGLTPRVAVIGWLIKNDHIKVTHVRGVHFEIQGV